MSSSLNRRNFLLQSVLAVGATYSIKLPTKVDPPSWVEWNNKIYGAKPDERGAIGGGENYRNVITGGDYEVDNLDDLVDALGKAKSGQVVFIKDETEIDLTVDIYIDNFILQIPAGVTLAGCRGYRGSKGALIESDALKTSGMIQALGPKVRITGLRVKGPNPKQQMRHHRRSFTTEKLGSDHYYKFPTSRGILSEHDQLEVDNCEITAFGHSGINLRSGTGHHIHHNYIHHCQYHGLGYGVSHSAASSLIEYNLFDSNRHSIAGTGAADSEYIARHNIEMGAASSHCFDMHGGRDRKDGTNIAGKKMEIYNNTFWVPDQRAVVVRGEPIERVDVFQNWFPNYQDPQKAVRGESRTHTFDNLYGKENKMVL